MYSIILIFLVKVSSKNAMKMKIWKCLGLLLLRVCKEDCKTFCPMSRIRPVSARPALQR